MGSSQEEQNSPEEEEGKSHLPNNNEDAPFPLVLIHRSPRFDVSYNPLPMTSSNPLTHHFKPSPFPSVSFLPLVPFRSLLKPSNSSRLWSS